MHVSKQMTLKEFKHTISIYQQAEIITRDFKQEMMTEDIYIYRMLIYVYYDAIGLINVNRFVTKYQAIPHNFNVEIVPV
jgi:hypothetical protein